MYETSGGQPGGRMEAEQETSGRRPGGRSERRSQGLQVDRLGSDQQNRQLNGANLEEGVRRRHSMTSGLGNEVHERCMRPQAENLGARQRRRRSRTPKANGLRAAGLADGERGSSGLASAGLGNGELGNSGLVSTGSADWGSGL